MIYYTFKANDEFYVFRELFDDVYAEVVNQLQAQDFFRDFKTITSVVDSINGEDVWGITHHWPDIGCFKKYMQIFSDLCTNDMVDYLNSHPVKRYVSVVNDQGKSLFPETLLPNLNGQKYIDWIDTILPAQ